MLTSEFDYDLPASSIAQSAIEPRDASRLLRVSTMEDLEFSSLSTMLHPGDLVVVNRTRVRRARLMGFRTETGGAVELLLLRPLEGPRWEALIRPARRMRAGVKLSFDGLTAQVVSDPIHGRITVDLDSSLPVEEALATAGRLPLPPYFHGNLEDPDRYQTLFAKVTGSAAAPTAALHFTQDTVEGLRGAGVELAEVELEVGLDTFRPMGDGLVADHEIHRELFTVPEAASHAVAAARERGGRIIAVGTTVMRTLETAAHGDGVLAGAGESSLFITPGYRVRVVDALLTNFHAPRTTLTVLVAALIGPQWREVYQTAIDRGYRFLSFGDAMFIENLREP